MASNSNNYVQLDGESFDADDWHSLSVNPSRLTCPAGRGGKWSVLATVDVAYTSAGVARSIFVTKNGAKTTEVVTSSPGGNAHHAMQASDVLQLVPGDYVEMAIYTNDASTIITGYFQPSLVLAYLGA